jgi:hypothetical protein
MRIAWGAAVEAEQEREREAMWTVEPIVVDSDTPGKNQETARPWGRITR